MAAKWSAYTDPANYRSGERRPVLTTALSRRAMTLGANVEAYADTSSVGGPVEQVRGLCSVLRCEFV